MSSDSSRDAISASRRDASSIASDMRLASIFTCGFSALTMTSGGLVDEAIAVQASARAGPPAPRMSAESDALPASATPQAPPRRARTRSHLGSEGSTRASNAGQDSKRMERSRFLSLVAHVTMWSRCETSDLAASRPPSRSGTGSSASGRPMAVLANTWASRSSVLASPANILEA